MMTTTIKTGLIIIFIGFVNFCIGMQFPKAEGAYLCYDVFVAQSFFIISLGFSEIAHPWIERKLFVGAILSWIAVISTMAWFFCELTKNATHHTFIRPIVGLVTLILLIIQFKNRSK